MPRGKAEAVKEEGQEKKVILTSKEQEIRSMVERATDGPPRVTDYKELFTRKEMKIPDTVKRPECAYRWLSVDNLQREVLGHERWAIVTRSNHSHAPAHIFGDSGGIMWGADAILCFQWREQAEAVQKHIEREFNLGAERVINPEPKKYHGPGGKEMAILEPVSGEGLGRATREDELTSDAEYDFSAP